MLMPPLVRNNEQLFMDIDKINKSLYIIGIKALLYYIEDVNSYTCMVYAPPQQINIKMF